MRPPRAEVGAREAREKSSRPKHLLGVIIGSPLRRRLSRAQEDSEARVSKAVEVRSTNGKEGLMAREAPKPKPDRADKTRT